MPTVGLGRAKRRFSLPHLWLWTATVIYLDDYPNGCSRRSCPGPLDYESSMHYYTTLLQKVWELQAVSPHSWGRWPWSRNPTGRFPLPTLTQKRPVSLTSRRPTNYYALLDGSRTRVTGLLIGSLRLPKDGILRTLSPKL